MTPTPMSSTRTMPGPVAAILLVLPCLALAGCASDGGTTSIAIDFAAGHEDLQGTVALDADGAITAYEQLLAWSDAAGIPVAVRSFSFGPCVDSIDGLPTTPGCSPGAEAYWSLSVDGAVSDVGMDAIELNDGSKVTWTYTPTASGDADGDGLADPSPGLDPDPLGATVDPPAPTQAETAKLTGSVNHPARVSIDGGPAADMPAGRWELVSQPLGFGQTPATVRIEDGVHAVALQVTFVRLATATMRVTYTAYPVHADLEDIVVYDPDTLASAADYEGTATARAPEFTVHDLMALWTVQTGIAVVYSRSDSFGFGVEEIDGVGNTLDAGDPPWWCYQLNGESADLGISLQQVAPGDVVTWDLGTCT